MVFWKWYRTTKSCLERRIIGERARQRKMYTLDRIKPPRPHIWPSLIFSIRLMSKISSLLTVYLQMVALDVGLKGWIRWKVSNRSPRCCYWHNYTDMITVSVTITVITTFNTTNTTKSIEHLCYPIMSGKRRTGVEWWLFLLAGEIPKFNLLLRSRLLQKV